MISFAMELYFLRTSAPKIECLDYLCLDFDPIHNEGGLRGLPHNKNILEI